MADSAARFIVERAKACVNSQDRFVLALSGGKTPIPLYERLASPEFNAAMPWEKTHVFWGDERCIDFDNEASNAGAAQRALLDRVPIPKENIHRAPVQNASPKRSAELWEADLRNFFGKNASFPSFDLILLGAGRDGHTASIFPGHPALQEKSRWTFPVEAPGASPPLPRVTLTLPVIEHAGCILFLLGKEKEFLLKELELNPAEAARRYPAARIRPSGELFYFISQ